MNRAENGIGMLNNLHLTGHPTYTTKISEKLSDISQTLPPDEIYTRVNQLIGQVRALIQQNPNLNSGQIANLIQ
jgi:hypothetical protein